MPQMPRRTLLAAASWAIPVISVNAALPAYAATSASGRLSMTIDRTSLYPDEVTTVRVVSTDVDGTPRAGDVVTLSLDDGGRALVAQATGVTDGSGMFATSLRVRTGAAPGVASVTASTPAGVASASFDVRPLSVIQHDETGTSTRVLALPHGYQDAVTAIENRSYSHSDLQPTGRHVAANQVLQVDVEAGAPATLSLAIGTRGPWSGFNGGQGTDLSVTALSPGTQTITAPQDGIVFVVNHSETATVALTISGGAPQPVWVKDRTTPDEFATQLAQWTGPVVSFVGERMFADIQRRVIDDVKSRGVTWDAADMVFRLDRVLSSTCDIYGLTYAAVGVGRKRAGRVYFSGADSGAGWAFATSQWLCFQVNTGASETLLVDPDSWGIWHEVGHTFQTPSYTWGGMGEVTVNISSLALQQRHTGQHRLDEWPELQDRIRQFFAQPIADRVYWHLNEENVFLGLFPFDQLRQSFGEGFYPAVDQVYRVRRAQGKSMPGNDQDKIDMFAEMTSKVAQRNLAPFFAEWGLRLSSSAVASLQGYPALQYPIWEAITSTAAHRERTVGYNLPIGDLSAPAQALWLGDTTGNGAVVTGLSSLDGSPSHEVERGATAVNVGPAEGHLWSLLESTDATPELLTQTAAVQVASALEFVGIYDIRAGWIGLNRDGTALIATSTGFAPHDWYFKGKPYYKVTLQNASRQSVVSVTVNGDETHDKVVAALNGVACGNNWRLIVEAAEPWRARTWSDSKKAGALSANPQTVLISRGHLVPR